MPEDLKNASNESSNELIQLRFDSSGKEVQDMNAAELSDVLSGLVEFTGQIAKAGQFGKGPAPEVRVRPTKEGSYIIEATLQWFVDNPEGGIGTAIASGGGLVKTLEFAYKRLRGVEYKDFEHLGNGNVKVTWPNDKVDEVPLAVWKQLRNMKRPTRRALRKIMAPLSDDIDILEVRRSDTSSSTESILDSDPRVTFEREDYRKVAPDDDVEELPSTVFTAEAQIISPDFRPYEKWLIKTIDGTRRALMEDDEFQREFNRGMEIHEDDLFEITISEEVGIKNSRRKIDWTITNVRRKKRRKREGGVDNAKQSPRSNP